MFKVDKSKIKYSISPKDNDAYTNKMDKIYTRYAKAYDVFISVFPLWKKWLKSVLPYVKGERILEVSFGPAWLMRKYPKTSSIYGIDYNEKMVARAKEKMKKIGRSAEIVQGNVESMPYESNYFDCVVNTMAFTGYPDGEKALSEMLRVLKHDGTLLLLDYEYPPNLNIFGVSMVRLIEKCGDITKDIGALLEAQKVDYQRKIIGGFSSIQLFIIKKK